MLFLLFIDVIINNKLMKLDLVASSQNDEFYTPPYAIKPLLKYLKPKSKIWCCFDTENSWYVKLLREEGHTVYHSSILTGGDFFEIIDKHTPLLKKGLDYIISNPPYSKKDEVLTYLFTLDIPFAMLMGVVGIYESKTRFELFKNNIFEEMFFNKRISYFKNYNDQIPSLNPPFSSIYVCHNVLPTTKVFEEVFKPKLPRKKKEVKIKHEI